MEETPIMVPLARLPVDDSAQTRVRVNVAVIKEYAAAMTEQRAEGRLRFPPVSLFKDGQVYWVGDGVHRVRAALAAGFSEILAQVRNGSQRDAILFGISANNSA